MTQFDECTVRLIDLPYSVPALVSIDADGFASIYLNARLSRESQLLGYRHEIKHVIDSDVFSDRDIKSVEGC